MTKATEDTGPTATQLCRLAWVLALVALGACVRIGMFAADNQRVQAEHVFWLAVCITAVTFSGCCAVLTGMKSAEERLRQHVQPGQHDDV